MRKKRQKKRIIKIKKAGWLYTLICIVMGVAAVNTGNNLVFILVSIMLGFMGVSGFYGKRNIERLKLSINIPDEVYAGGLFPCEVVIENNRRFLPAVLIRVELAGQSILFPYIEPAGRAVRIVNFKAGSRGRHKLSDFSFSSVFPFNFFVRYKDARYETGYVSFPAMLPCSYLESGYGKRRQGEMQSDVKGFNSDLLYIRDYDEGDPVKYIHWKAFAKTGVMKTKILSSETVPPVTVDIDKISEPDGEKKLSCAAYLINDYFSKGIPVTLKTADKSIGPCTVRADRLSALRELAVL